MGWERGLSMGGFGFQVASVHNDRGETRPGNQLDKLGKAGVGMPDNTLPDGVLILWLQDPVYRAAGVLSLACYGFSLLRREAQFFYPAASAIHAEDKPLHHSILPPSPRCMCRRYRRGACKCGAVQCSMLGMIPRSDLVRAPALGAHP